MQIKPKSIMKSQRYTFQRATLFRRRANVDSLTQRSLFLAKLRYNVQTINFIPI